MTKTSGKEPRSLTPGQVILAVIPAAVCGVFSVFRHQLVLTSRLEGIPNIDHVQFQMALSDAAYGAFVLLLGILAQCGPKAARAVFAAAAPLAAVLAIADVMLYLFFGSRLIYYILFDIIDGLKIFLNAKNLWPLVLGLSLVSVTLVSVYILLVMRSPGAKFGKNVLAAAGVTGALLSFDLSQAIGTDRTLWSAGLISLNVDTYRASLKPAALPPLPPGTSITHGLDQKRPIIVLVLESWSCRHSGICGGPSHATPRLDEWARRSRALSNLHANGSYTEAGLIAMIAGFEPFRNGHGNSLFGITNFAGHRNPDQTIAHAAPDTAIFVTGGDLSFDDKENWLREAGFTTILGSEWDAFDGMERGMFQAPPDRVLLNHANALARNVVKHGESSLMVVETVSSHMPLRHPETGSRSEMDVFGYVDETGAAFIDQVVDDGLIDKGVILVVVSDHRLPIALTAKDRERFGPAAGSPIPGFIISRETLADPGPEAAFLSQVELATAIRRWLGASTEHPVYRGHLDLQHSRSAEKIVFVPAGRREPVVLEPPAP